MRINDVLPRSVGAEHDPSLAGLDAPGDVGEDRSAVANEPYVTQLQGRHVGQEPSGSRGADPLGQAGPRRFDLVEQQLLDQRTAERPAVVQRHLQRAVVLAHRLHARFEHPRRVVAPVELTTLESNATARLVHRPNHSQALRPSERADPPAQLDEPHRAVVGIGLSGGFGARHDRQPLRIAGQVLDLLEQHIGRTRRVHGGRHIHGGHSGVRASGLPFHSPSVSNS